MIGNFQELEAVRTYAASSVTGEIERRGFLPIGHQFGKAARIHHRAGKLVSSDFARLFQNINIFSGKLGLGAGRIVRAIRLERCSAQASPAGPAPTIRTSASSRSRSTVTPHPSRRARCAGAGLSTLLLRCNRAAMLWVISEGYARTSGMLKERQARKGEDAASGIGARRPEP